MALAAANSELARSKDAVQARYDLAVEAVRTFHTGVSEDFLLKEDQFKELRDRLLKSASDFYGKLGALLGRESDTASRLALARANFEVAALTRLVGRTEEALAAHRKVLAAREALASEPGSGDRCQGRRRPQPDRHRAAAGIDWQDQRGGGGVPRGRTAASRPGGPSPVRRGSVRARVLQEPARLAAQTDRPHR